MNVIRRSHLGSGASALLGFILISLVWFGQPAAGVQCGTSALDFLCKEDEESGDPGENPETSIPDSYSGPISYDIRPFKEGRTEADEGRPCLAIVAFPNDDHYTWEEAYYQLSLMDAGYIQMGHCAPIEGEEAPLPSPGEIAAQMWQEVAAPPPPTPLRVAPGMALTGLPAYLEIGGEVPHVATFDTVRGELTITMTPRYEIDWGDGASAESDDQGRPYPGGPGEIVHTYTDTGSVTITVSAFWRATWSLAGEGGDLPELSVPTTGSLQLSVEQRQAVTD